MGSEVIAFALTGLLAVISRINDCGCALIRLRT